MKYTFYFKYIDLNWCKIDLKLMIKLLKIDYLNVLNEIRRNKKQILNYCNKLYIFNKKYNTYEHN